MWFSIDLKERKALVTHYTLRHVRSALLSGTVATALSDVVFVFHFVWCGSWEQYTSWDAEALRNWRLEASNDGHNWVVLRTHTDDNALNGKGSTASWPIERPESKGAFSLFRLYQTGVNSNAHHYLACSGWEMYGKLYTPSAAQPAGNAAISSVQCVYQSDFDMNGVFYHLGSAGKTVAWKNPGEIGVVQCYCLRTCL